MKKSGKLWVSLLMMLILAVSLVACGGGSTAPAGGAQEPAAEEAAEPEAEPATEPAAEAPADDPVAAAEAKYGPLEDKVVIYTSMTQDDLDALIYCFNEVYPDIEIEVVNGTQGELNSRIMAEADNPQGDLVWCGLTDSDGDSLADLFEKWVSEYDAQNLDGYTSNNGMYSMDITSTVCLAVNTRLEKEMGLNITSYADLLNPELKGKIIFSDPNSSSAAWNNLCNIMSVFGLDTDEAWDYIAQLMPNIKISDSSSACFNSVKDGEYVCGITYESGAVKLIMNGAEDYELRYFDEGVSASAFGSAIIKNCQHPNAARVLIDFTCSADGQNAMAEYDQGTLRFLNKGFVFPEDGYLLPTSEIKWVERPVLELADKKADLLEHWNTLWAQYGSDK